MIRSDGFGIDSYGGALAPQSGKTGDRPVLDSALAHPAGDVRMNSPEDPPVRPVPPLPEKYPGLHGRRVIVTGPIDY